MATLDNLQTSWLSFPNCWNRPKSFNWLRAGLQTPHYLGEPSSEPASFWTVVPRTDMIFQMENGQGRAQWNYLFTFHISKLPISLKEGFCLLPVILTLLSVYLKISFPILGNVSHCSFMFNVWLNKNLFYVKNCCQAKSHSHPSQIFCIKQLLDGWWTGTGFCFVFLLYQLIVRSAMQDGVNRTMKINSLALLHGLGCCRL